MRGGDGGGGVQTISICTENHSFTSCVEVPFHQTSQWFVLPRSESEVVHTETGQQADGATDSDQVQQQQLSGSAAPLQDRQLPTRNCRNRLSRRPKLKQKRQDEGLPSLPETGMSSRRNVRSFAAKVFVEEMDDHDTAQLFGSGAVGGFCVSLHPPRTVYLQPFPECSVPRGSDVNCVHLYPSNEDNGRLHLYLYSNITSCLWVRNLPLDFP